MAMKTKTKEHFRTSVNIVFFYGHEKLLPWTEYICFFSLWWLTLLMGLKLSLFVSKVIASAMLLLIYSWD